jgi:hypothetical protein
LNTSTTEYEQSVAKKALQNMYDDLAKTPWLEDKADDIAKLLKKEKYTLSELDRIKSTMDDMYNLYTQAWWETAWLKAEWLRNIRRDLRKFIEDKATEEWLWNIKMINNEISVARWLRDWISRKDSADAAREMLSIFSKWTVGWSMLWLSGQWPFDNNTPAWKIGNFIVWALAWQFLFSTKAKTTLASWINKLSWWTKKELIRYITSEWAEKLSENTLKSLWKLIEETGVEWLPSLLNKTDVARVGLIWLTNND